MDPKIAGEACFPGSWQIADQRREIESHLATMQKEKEKLVTIARREGVKKHPYSILRQDILDQTENSDRTD